MFCKPLTKILYLMYLQFWFYLDISKTKTFLSSSPHHDGNSYADKLKNSHMRKNQQKLKNQHAGSRRLTTPSSVLADGGSSQCIFIKTGSHKTVIMVNLTYLISKKILNYPLSIAPSHHFQLLYRISKDVPKMFENIKMEKDCHNRRM